MAQERIHQLDYLKGIFIVLMVLFHLALVESTYPIAREAVYTFHMSAFLLISGYLANVEKKPSAFFKSVMHILLPYLLFESLYIVMQYNLGSALGAHNAIGTLTATDFLTRMLTLPTGPYWYLHTLVICTLIYYLVYRLLKLQGIAGLALSGLLLYGLSLVIEGLDWSNVIYFLIGMSILRSGNSLLRVITPSFIAVLPLMVLFSNRENFHNGSLAGVAITLLVMSVLLAFYPYCGKAVRSTACFLGRNSLAIVVFSPIFTLATKAAMPLFTFDTTAVSFAVTAVAFVVLCCLGCAWLCDRLKLSPIIFLKEGIFSPYRKI